MDTYPVSDLNQVRRQPSRGHYDHATVHGLLDAARVASVGFVADGRPMVIPMMCARDGDSVLLHGARKGRIATTLEGAPVCVTVMFEDALVFARSIFHSSMNYRSAVVFGTARAIADVDEKLRALQVLSEHLMPGRWAEVRAPLAKELKGTEVLRVEIETASAKIRDFGVLDDLDDYSAEDWERTWAGVVPIAAGLGQPIADASVRQRLPVPASIRRMLGAR